MTTEAEIAAGEALVDFIMRFKSGTARLEYPTPFTEARAIVRAYQRAAWREPTEEDWDSDEKVLITQRFVTGHWTKPYFMKLKTYSQSKRDHDLMIADSPPLPEPMETTDAEL